MTWYAPLLYGMLIVYCLLISFLNSQFLSGVQGASLKGLALCSLTFLDHSFCKKLLLNGLTFISLNSGLFFFLETTRFLLRPLGVKLLLPCTIIGSPSYLDHIILKNNIKVKNYYLQNTTLTFFGRVSKKRM